MNIRIIGASLALGYADIKQDGIGLSVNFA